MRFHGAETFYGSQPVFSYTRNSTHFMKPDESLPHSQAPATCPYTEPDEASVQVYARTPIS